MKKTILVTGASGFIGKNTVKFLANFSQEIKLIGTSRHTGIQEKYCKEYIEAELGDNNFVTRFDKIDKIDIIIHTAACISYDNFDKTLINSNCKGILQICELAKKHNCKKIIYISSIPIIGKHKIIPITEEHPISPMSTYHATKFFGENILNFALNSKIVTIILRIPSPIGVDMPENKIFSIFAKKALNNEDIYIDGNGLRIQNYIDVDDISNAILLTLKYSKSNTFNIASLKSYSNIELAKKCIEIFNSKSKIIYTGKNDPQEDYNWTISTKKACSELGYKQIYTLEDTLIKWKKSYSKKSEI